MSVSTEVQRTLVKSPPELWAELGNVEGLSRHFGEIGEIRVTKVEPETKVEWEAGLASGFVELKQSGWGTKVTLSLTRATPEPEPSDELAIKASDAAVVAKPEVGASSLPDTPEQPDAELESATAEPEPMVVREVRPEPERPEPVVEVIAAEAEQRGGFFARLFKRKRQPPIAAEVPPNPEPRPEPELQALALPDPVYPPAPPKPVETAPETVEAVEPTADPGTELAEIDAQMQRQATELLTGVLDRLGAAHHRPFSRG